MERATHRSVKFYASHEACNTSVFAIVAIKNTDSAEREAVLDARNPHRNICHCELDDFCAQAAPAPERRRLLQLLRHCTAFERARTEYRL